MALKTKFDPTTATADQIADWIRAGDIAAAEDTAAQLAIFLWSLANNKDAMLALIKMGVPIVGSDVASLISERLLHVPSAGSRQKSGAKLFAKVLVPGKPTKSQWLMRYLAGTVHMNLPDDADGALSKAHAKEITYFLNQVIESNNIAYNSGRPTESWNPAMPKKRVTVNEVEKAYRKYLDEIRAANGVHRVKTR